MSYHILTADILNKFYPLNRLDRDEVNLLLQQTRIENIHRGNIIFRQGDDDSDVIFLISGSVRLESENGARFILDSTSDQAVYPIANIKPRNFSAFGHSDSASIARLPSKIIESFIFNLDKDKLWMSGAVEPDPDHHILDTEWMMAMKKTPLFQKLDEEYITQLFQVMEKVFYKSGERIIKQGDVGEDFFLIKEGVCQVTRSDGDKEVLLAELETTDSFGEDALLTKSRRNANVTMTTDGVLMRISKEDFDRFMFQPVVHWIKLTEAVKLCKTGAMQVDVRKDSEQKKSFQNATKIPLNRLRSRIPELDKAKSYLLICDNSNEGAVASYLFSKYGIENYILSTENASKVQS